MNRSQLILTRKTFDQFSRLDAVPKIHFSCDGSIDFLSRGCASNYRTGDTASASDPGTDDDTDPPIWMWEYEADLQGGEGQWVRGVLWRLQEGAAAIELAQMLITILSDKAKDEDPLTYLARGLL